MLLIRVLLIRVLLIRVLFLPTMAWPLAFAALPGLMLPPDGLTSLTFLRRTLALSILLAGFWLPRPAGAADLLMFEERGCPWCLRWKQEVGVGYPRTPEGQRAPVRSIEMPARAPAGVTLALPVRVSPTFVLIDDGGREIGRIVGYPGADFFWGLFSEIVSRLPPKTAGQAPHG